MKKINNTEVIVHISLQGKNIRVGKLWFHLHRGRNNVSFEYDEKWLQHPDRFSLEPSLQLTEGTFHTQVGKNIFGAIGDSMPDRWGRLLMRRGEIIKNKNQSTHTLTEMDYLLGVNDEARQGALRFSVKPNDTLFLAPKQHNAIPPFLSLSKLLSASERFLQKDENLEDLKLLLAPASSLGGARPKASVYDKEGHLCIAKFPKPDDDFNNVIWEAVALHLAKRAGINVPLWKLETILDKPVLILKRFDRNEQIRIPFLSAMSMLGAQDNEQHSYIEIAYALLQNGCDPKTDMEELWRRIIFTILISNTDDHLRNHGFLYETHRKGWRLSPIYDINPTPKEIKPRILTTAIDFENTLASLNTAMTIIEEFRITKQKAKHILKKVALAIKPWRKIASQFGLSKHEIDRMSSAFEHDDSKQAEKF